MMVTASDYPYKQDLHRYHEEWAPAERGRESGTVHITYKLSRILEYQSRFSDCCSDDFSPHLPANQLNNNQKIDFGVLKSGVRS